MKILLKAIYSEDDLTRLFNFVKNGIEMSRQSHAITWIISKLESLTGEDTVVALPLVQVCLTI